MKKKRIVKKVSLFFVMLLVFVNIQLLPVSAGASDIVINSNSFEKELDTSLWNNPDHDITIQNGVLIFPKDSTNSTALVSKVNARKSEQHTELIHANINMKFTQLPSDQRFVLAFGLASVESTYGEAGNVEVEFTNNGGLKVGVVAYDEDETAVTVAEPVVCGTVGNVLKIQAAISTDGIVTLQINNKNKELVNIDDIKTDVKFENVSYDSVEDIWNDSIIGILTIEKIGLNATIKEGTSKEVLLNYIGHIEETATYDGNVGLAGHNRGYANSYFARINELEVGDIIKYKTKFFDRIYVVDNIQVIYETDWSLLESTQENKLSLITCIAGKKEQRLCVQATEMTCNSTDTELQ